MEKRSLGTHSGSFHADEVTACALLLLFNLIDKDKIVRTRDLARLEKCEWVCDVGGIYNPELKRFDHHQSDYKGDLSSAGMVLADLKRRGIIDQPTYDCFNRGLVIGVDAHDNGKVEYETGICTFSHVVSNFVPIVYDAPKEQQDKAFFEALDFVVGHIRRLLERFQYSRSCREKVEQAMANNKDFLIFDKSMPWIDSFFDLGGEMHPAQFVIMPSGEHWKLRGIPPNSQERMKVRHPLPEKWAGLLDEDLKRVTGIPGAIFCHKGRFISVWETKEDAIKALMKILEEKL